MNKENKEINIMGYRVFTGSLSSIKQEKAKLIVNTLNPHSYAVAKKDSLFERALKSSDYLIPDGSGIVLAASQISQIEIKKIAGADLHQHLLRELNKTGGSVFYMGASKYTLKKIGQRLSNEFQNISFSSYSPPFKDSFSEEENKVIIDKINSVNPDVLFVGMTAPKQEKWLEENKTKLKFKLAASIGAVFDFYAGTVKRPHRLWVKLHLEWLARLVKEPKRMWRRNIISTPIFLLDLFLYKVRFKK